MQLYVHISTHHAHNMRTIKTIQMMNLSSCFTKKKKSLCLPNLVGNHGNDMLVKSPFYLACIPPCWWLQAAVLLGVILGIAFERSHQP